MFLSHAQVARVLQVAAGSRVRKSVAGGVDACTEQEADAASCVSVSVPVTVSVSVSVSVRACVLSVSTSVAPLTPRAGMYSQSWKVGHLLRCLCGLIGNRLVMYVCMS